MNVVGFLVISNNHRINVYSEIDRAIAGINSISDSLHFFGTIEGMLMIANREFKK